MPKPELPENLPSDFSAAIAYLGTRSRLDVEDMKILALVECAGEILYQHLASLATPAEAAELLLRNGREETAHAHRLKKAIELTSGEDWALPELSDNPYAVAPPVSELTAELLAGLREGEIGGKAGYEGWADHEEQAEIAALLRQNGREEGRHAERVSNVMALLGD